MRYVEVKELTDIEERMRWHLQYELNTMKRLGTESAEFEWSGILRFANCIVDKPKVWATKHGGQVVLLIDYGKKGETK